MPTPLRSAAFFGPGIFLNTLDRNRYTGTWVAFGASVLLPRAILLVSAHWYVKALAVTAIPRPRTIHDRCGFPQALFDVQYPVPGSAALAGEVADLVKPDDVGQDVDGACLGPGTWSAKGSNKDL